MKKYYCIWLFFCVGVFSLPAQQLYNTTPERIENYRSYSKEALQKFYIRLVEYAKSPQEDRGDFLISIRNECAPEAVFTIDYNKEDTHRTRPGTIDDYVNGFFSQYIKNYKGKQIEFKQSNFKFGNFYLTQDMVSTYVEVIFDNTFWINNAPQFTRQVTAVCFFPVNRDFTNVKIQQIIPAKVMASKSGSTSHESTSASSRSKQEPPVQRPAKKEETFANSNKNINLKSRLQLYEEATALYVQNKYVEALSLYKQSAELGHAAAQYYVGNMYEYGRGIAQNEREAAKWYRASADQGDVKAQFSLGYMYENGKGVNKDLKEAARWYDKAALQGHKRAQKRLEDKTLASYSEYSTLMQKRSRSSADMTKETYDKAKAMFQKRDYRAALALYMMAADLGDVDAHFQTAKMYALGLGVTTNHTEALNWYRKAADKGSIEAQYTLASKYEYGNGVTKNEAEAIKLYQKAADKDHAPSQYSLGFMYEKGKGVTKNLDNAIYWYRKAAAKGDAQAKKRLEDKNLASHSLHSASTQKTSLFPAYKIEETYENAKVMFQKKDYCAALELYVLAADLGHVDAHYRVANMYALGLGVTTNEHEALSWYRKAADEGSIEAQYTLASKYEYGNGVTKNEAEAIKLYQKAANKDHAPSQYSLGFMYESGKGVTKNLDNAIYWYRKAAAKGDANAKKRLSYLKVK